ncbi:MAG: Rpn family recombination-promoting nuclease/putative transposase [Bacteroidetes bacterium]|nr:Rpn family recombination-promoting nuclease/putative transposase [Bacteroidota bacterium]
MIIANPIYDTVFKRMMENERVAKFFIGTLLEQEIVAVEVKPQEFTWMDDLDQDDPKVQQYINAKLKERLSINIYRVDFIATIKTEAGEYKKVLIEIQKAKNKIDLMRFRRYLGEQYKKEDQISNEKAVLPITTIYILGFTLPEIETACIRVERNYKDLINKTIIEKKSDFVEKLTHDSYIVQVDRITNRFQTRLDKLLSVFEQSNFIDDRKIIKQFPHPTDTEDVKILTDILHHSGSDPDERKRIEDEQEAWRTINAMFGYKEEAFLKALQEKDKILHEKNIALDEKDKALDEKDKALDEKDKALDEKNRLNADLLQQLEELKRKLGER